MEAMTVIIRGLAMIDAKLWEIMKSQRNHNQAVEQLLGRFATEHRPNDLGGSNAGF
ncbi:MAG TPA: hypothetical protein VFE51_08605 [Verrucomicrobiae bacterium]|nr:hypothetical protein [Verrucomicrobiae bacterium]